MKEDAKEAKAKMRMAKRTHLVILKVLVEDLAQTDVGRFGGCHFKVACPRPAHCAWPLSRGDGEFSW